MINLKRIARLPRFAGDYVRCIKLMNSPSSAYGYLRSGLEPEIGSFHLGVCNFQARKEDWLAIKEVLIQDEYLCIESLLADQESPKVIDLGGNIGCFALRVFIFAPNARIASVEAAADTFDVLKTNQELNTFFNWTLFNNGIWSHEEALSLMRRGISMGHRVIENGDGDVVQGMTLHSLIKKLDWDTVDLIKMDIEGGEEKVIPCALDVLKQTRFLIIEIHTDRINAKPVMEALHSVYSETWQLNERTSSKPLLVLTNDEIDLGLNAQKISRENEWWKTGGRV